MPKTNRNPLDNQAKVTAFLDSVRDGNQLKNDAALARFVSLPAPILSKLHHGRLNFSAYHVLKFHIGANIPVTEIMDRTGYDLKVSKE